MNRNRRSDRTARTGRRAVSMVAALGVAASVLLLGPAAHADYIRDLEYWLDDYGIRDAWAVTEGEGVTIAIIDTGVDGSVDDLANAVIGGRDFSGIGSPDGQRGVGSSGDHGTWVASLAAGHGYGPGNESGIKGSAPKAKILTASIGFGVGTSHSDDQIAEAVKWAVDAGADVINMSLTRNTLEWPTSWDEAFLYAFDNDVVVVAAAGNRGSGTSQVGAPATMPGVLTVGGLDRSGKASWDASSQGITIGVTAPSEELVGVSQGGSYVAWEGTSGATPIVAGVVALVRAAHPELDAANVIHRIRETARPVDGQEHSPIYGSGHLDAAAAVSASVPRIDSSPAAELREWIRVHRRADADPGATLAPIPPVETPSVPVPQPGASVDNPLGTVLPDVVALRDVGIPLLLYVGLAGALVVWGVLFRRAVVRRNR